MFQTIKNALKNFHNDTMENLEIMARTAPKFAAVVLPVGMGCQLINVPLSIVFPVLAPVTCYSVYANCVLAKNLYSVVKEHGWGSQSLSAQYENLLGIYEQKEMGRQGHHLSLVK